MRLAIVADTHVPSRATAIPAWVESELRAADHVVHAGDFDSESAYERVAGLADGLTAVSGNMDRDLGLPAVATLDVEGVRFVVTHGTGTPAGYERRVASTVAEHARADGPTVGIAGHTHEVLDTEVDGYRLLNPGSATGAPPASRATMVAVRVADGSLEVREREGEPDDGESERK